ncbi:MAG: hypothetical protein ACKPKO_51465, partial [Candidatus Fonsibacter sp.]
SMAYGRFLVSLESFWKQIKSVAWRTKHDPSALNPWHHCDSSDQWRLIHYWDALMKRLVYLARINAGIGAT